MTQVRNYVQKGQLEKAMAEYRQRLKKPKCNPRILHRLAELQIRSGDRKGGLQNLIEVANRYQKDGMLKWAASVLKQVLSLDPNLAEIRMRLSETYLDLELKREAARQLRMAAVWYLQEGRTHEYVHALERLVSVEPDNLADRLELAQHFATSNDEEQAAKHFALAAITLQKAGRDFIFFGEHAFCRGDETVRLLNDMARVCLERGEFRRALEKLERSIQVDANNLETMKMLIMALVREGRLEEAQSRSQATLDRLTAQKHEGMVEFTDWLQKFEQYEGLLLLSWLGEVLPCDPDTPAAPAELALELPGEESLELVSLQECLMPAWEGGSEGTDPGW
jgi:thioredoxin-like negative regulator of GroEL